MPRVNLTVICKDPSNQTL